MLITGPRGTKDVLPEASAHWQYVEKTAREVCRTYAYQEIRTPIFEHTELFLRGIGETTDIVQKEMYTFNDRGGRSVTLRPENTASVVRSYLENKLYSGPQPTKVYYIGPMFRYDRPQAGRLRQFHQFGLEAIGAGGPAVDAEIIMAAVQFFRKLGLTDLNLFINSVGCPKCRPVYRTRLQEALRDKLPDFCPDCQSRFDRNPMRILDCKSEKCAELSADAPEMAECLCEECAGHFAGLKELLTAAGVDYKVNPRLVRGLDYYTKTAFEIQYPLLGAQSAICGGGRYDGLIEECGGDPTPAIGYAIGLERVLLALEKQSLLPAIPTEIDVFVAAVDDATRAKAFQLLCGLRRAGLRCDMDFMERSLKAQLKQANRYPARFVAIIGEEEAAQDKVTLKNMTTGEQELVDAAGIGAKLKGDLEE
ncbi:MAG TPA: histidine--tRNA ligase [Selenomonadales bacterium]|nr:histidine--tRNA ligase [Selenomonadales bacterium]